MNIKRILLLVTLLVATAGAQDFSATTIKWLLQSPPAPASSGSASISGNPGNSTYFYWVVATYPVGNSAVAGPYVVLNAPNTLSASNKINISWQAALGATTYDVLRTTTPNPPTGACACAVATATSSQSATDQSNTLNAYTVNTFDFSTLPITLTNEVVGSGLSHLYLRQNGTLIADLSTGTQAGVSVLSFGAKCDGATDDIPAFTSAIGSGNVAVYVPDGRVCAVSTGVKMKNNTTLFSNGTGTVFLLAGRPNHTYTVQNDDFAGGNNHLVIRGVVIDANRLNQTPGLDIAPVQLQQVSDWLISNSEVKNGESESIYVLGAQPGAGATRGVLIGNNIHDGGPINSDGLGIHLDRTNITTVVGNVFANIGLRAIGCSRCTDGTFDGNTIFEAQEAIRIAGGQRLTITNNTAANIREYGMDIDVEAGTTPTDIVTANNIFYAKTGGGANNGHGYVVFTGNYVSSTNDEVIGFALDGFRVQDQLNTFVNPVARGNTGNAFTFNTGAATNNQITSYSFTGNALNAPTQTGGAAGNGWEDIPGVTFTSGAGAPGGACSNGSAYLRTDATAAGTGAYFCENSLWVARGSGGGGTGTVTHTVGALTAGAVMVGNGAADSKVTGVTIDGSNNLAGAASLQTTGVNGGVDFTEGTGAALTKAIAHGLLIEDSTLHRLMACHNSAACTYHQLVEAGVDINNSDQVTVTHLASALPVAQGGTGVATVTAYAPLFGGTTSTNPFQSGTVGNAGQRLTSNGAGAIATFQDPPKLLWKDWPAAAYQGANFSVAGNCGPTPTDCPGATATPTIVNTMKAMANFSNSTANEMEFPFTLPPQWTTAMGITTTLTWLTSVGDNTKNGVWNVSISCPVLGTTPDTAFNTLVSVTTAANASANVEIQSVANLTAGGGNLTNCAGGMLATIKIRRPTGAPDTIAANMSLLHAVASNTNIN